MIRSPGRRPLQTRIGDYASITPESPALPKLSLYSDHPVMPESVVILRNENSRQPASARRVSTDRIFMFPPGDVIVASHNSATRVRAPQAARRETDMGKLDGKIV